MLTETFLASIGTTNRKPDTSSATKDAGIFLHEHQPLLAQRHTFKKSACAPNCVAVSRSHIFAAQIDKAVVNVYSREKGNQEATVPFPERITSLALALDQTVLVLGTEGGRIILWETCTGRSLTGPQSHLQPVNVLAVDPTSKFLLSGSSDSNIHVWSIQSLLSFTAPANPTPLHTLSNHRGGITALAVGHSTSSANVVVSASKDNTAIVWDYQQNNLLATYLLGDAPLALALDAADRGFFATFEDGSIQYIDFYVSGDGETPNGAVDSLRNPDTSYTPITPAPSTRWHPTNQDLGAAQSITLSWDGTTILTGHSTGKIAAWSPVGSTHLKTVLNSLPGPVTNISFLTPTGFPTPTNEPKYKVHAIVKPRLDLKAHVSDGEVSSPVPAAYAFHAQLVDSISGVGARKTSKKSAFEEALTHTSFPSDMLERSLAELNVFTGSGQAHAASAPPVANGGEADFMVLDTKEDAGSEANEALERENKELREQLESLQRLQKATLKQLAELKEEKKKSKGTAVPAEKEKADEKTERERRSERVRRAVKNLGD
ncbi:wd repeat protein [Diplodia corticola]|uniref:Pre-rRNA-processing protein IPI3 n=1 Tax=Diplodia corticola TaxID=236234 RepID=A0A1J9RAE4_9PEZI|nr:wd repeat protein [Diplodia corticola]OJD37512.1 wd repeat protein [Diplodia corticola]